jgi:hypothetical protein
MTATEQVTQGGLGVAGTHLPSLGLLYIGRSGSKSKRSNKEAGQLLGVRARKKQLVRLFRQIRYLDCGFWLFDFSCFFCFFASYIRAASPIGATIEIKRILRLISWLRG